MAISKIYQQISIKEEKQVLLSLFQVIVGTFLLALFAQISIRLPFTPVPITGQTLGIMLIAPVLGREKVMSSLGLYILSAVIGLPVLAGAHSGSLYLVGCTGGYIIGLFLQAYLIANLYASSSQNNIGMVKTLLFASVLQLFCGALWLSFFVGIKNAVWLGITPFVLGEWLKIAITTSFLMHLKQSKTFQNFSS